MRDVNDNKTVEIEPFPLSPEAQAAHDADIQFIQRKLVQGDFPTDTPLRPMETGGGSTALDTPLSQREAGGISTSLDTPLYQRGAGGISQALDIPLTQRGAGGISDLNIDQIVQSKHDAQVKFSEQVGQLQAFGFHQQIASIAELKILAEIKDSKAYRGMSISRGDRMIPLKKWEDFCVSLGVTARKINMDLLNLEQLGEEFMNKARAMGLGYRDINKLRKLPEANRVKLLGRVEVDIGDKDAIVDLIDDLAAKHVREKSDLQAQLDKAQKHVDIIVKEETKGLEKERDALIAERDALQKQVADPAWEQSKRNAKAVFDAVQAINGAMTVFLKTLPKGQVPPPDIEAYIDTQLFHSHTIAENVSRNWLASKFWDDKP